MDLGIKGKIALVTGPANPGGNGRAIAIALAREGCDVACAAIDYGGACDASEQIKQIGRRSLVIKIDQTQYNEVKSGIGYIEKELGTIDILVCNAAWIGNISLIENMPAANWQKEPSVNLSGPFYLVKEVMPGMVLVD